VGKKKRCKKKAFRESKDIQAAANAQEAALGEAILPNMLSKASSCLPALLLFA